MNGGEAMTEKAQLGLTDSSWGDDLTQGHVRFVASNGFPQFPYSSLSCLLFKHFRG